MRAYKFYGFTVKISELYGGSQRRKIVPPGRKGRQKGKALWVSWHLCEILKEEWEAVVHQQGATPMGDALPEVKL